jgi:hypothetical protein
MQQRKPESDYWKEFEGIPLCHTPQSPQEEQILAAKGACLCGQ